MAKRRTLERWHPPVEPTRQEALLLKRLNRTKKLFRFLREHRHELFDDAFQEDLEGMYRGTGAGFRPYPRQRWRWPCCCKATPVHRTRRRSS